jgi:hypothetical protein
MSRFMSHREMKAASRVVGGQHNRIMELNTRVHLLEEIVKLILGEQNRDILVTQDGSVELVEKAPEPVVLPDNGGPVLYNQAGDVIDGATEVPLPAPVVI